MHNAYTEHTVAATFSYYYEYKTWSKKAK